MSAKVRGDFAHVRFISAGAGSGKTYRLTQELERALVEEGVAPARVIGTTFTVKAAAELRERVRERLIRGGRTALAEQTAQALIGTVHSVCERLLKRFAFELGLSPELHVASLEDCAVFFNQALDEALAERPETDTERPETERPETERPETERPERQKAESAVGPAHSLPVGTARLMNVLARRLSLGDWRGDVKQVADRARDNDIAPGVLVEMGKATADDLLAHFPPAIDGDWDRRLIGAVVGALDEIDLQLDSTKGTADYYAGLERAIYALRRPPCPWSVWIRLSKDGARKKSDAIAARVREAAGRFAAHPHFQADVRSYIEQVYAIAAATLERFRTIKTERGLIDFTDMEQLFLRALDVSAVRARLEGELELLLVDEFQDTNPMQLAIFMELAALARQVVFVGDVKQAIYGFRGCDPDLVHDTLAALIARGAGSDVLESSWRSRPDLVRYLNSVFVKAFEAEMAARHVELKPERAEQTGEPAVLGWTLEGRRASDRAASLARAVRGLVESGHVVVDPDTNRARPVRWGDVAVLAAKNENVEEIARALRAVQAPMKMTLSGLLAVPEIRLARACLRRLSDASDTLASAEIVAMSGAEAPESWIADRLRWLAAGADGHAWGEASHPILGRLRALRDATGTQSPVEIVARVLNSVGLREVATAWGPSAIKAAQRQRNLDALLNLAVQYESHCDSQHLAATLTGFLFWLEHPHSPELDLQPVVTTGDAVHVLTYHKAKGLEWPVVIATDFHYCWSSRLWDVRVERIGAGFDIERPLEHRVVRFWPAVFGGHGKGIPALEAILECDEAAACVGRGIAETRRLAYVGLTRARDALVLAVPAAKPKADAWIGAFHSEYLLPSSETLILADGKAIAARVLHVEGPVPEAAGETQTFAPRRLPERRPLADARPERVSPSQAPALDNASIARIVELGPRISIRSEDMALIGSGLHAAIAAELVNPGRNDALARTRALLAGYRIDAFIDAEEVVAAARRLAEWIVRELAPRRVRAEYPIAHGLADGRSVRGWIDVLVETEGGFVVIDHKSSPRPRSEWAAEALEHAGQLAMYRTALEAAGLRVRGCWIHFPVSGGAVQVVPPRPKPGPAGPADPL